MRNALMRRYWAYMLYCRGNARGPLGSTAGSDIFSLYNKHDPFTVTAKPPSRVRAGVPVRAGIIPDRLSTNLSWLAVGSHAVRRDAACVLSPEMSDIDGVPRRYMHESERGRETCVY